MPHQTIYLCLRPLSVGRVAIRWGIAGHDPAPDPTQLAQYIAFADAFNAEDRAKLETLQRGLKSRFYVPGPLAATNYQGTLRDFYTFMGRGSPGASLAARPGYGGDVSPPRSTHPSAADQF